MSFVILDQCPPGCEGAFIVGESGEKTGCGCKRDGSPCDCPNHVVKTVDKLGCDVIYQGPTHPHLHGTKCVAEYHEHEDERHHSGTVQIDGRDDVIYWYTPEQKERILARR
jgi:hypothetical protein